MSSTHKNGCITDGGPTFSYKKAKSTFVTMLFSAVLASAIFVLLLKTNMPENVLKADKNSIRFIKRENQEPPSNQMFLRDIYEQERPKEEKVKQIFRDMANLNNDPKFRGAPTSLVQNDDLYRVKKATVDSSDLSKSVDIEPENSESSGRKFRSLGSGFTIQTVKRTNMVSKSEDGGSSNEAPSKFRGLAIEANASDDKQPKLGNGSEFAKLSSQFRNSSLGKTRSFWRAPEAEADANANSNSNTNTNTNTNNTTTNTSNYRFLSFLAQLFPAKPVEKKVSSKNTLGDWKYNSQDGLLLPDVSDKDTIINLAQMAANAYTIKNGQDWNYLGDSWKTNSSIGWDSDGLRGYTFSSEKNDTIVVSFKGTSASLFMVGSGDTSVKDRLNDNRLFSCCCARDNISMKPACGCSSGKTSCNTKCLENALKLEDSYFVAASRIVADVTKTYPKSLIILTGHSLGASVASLVALAFGLPAVVFGAPGDLMAAKRLNLPLPDNKSYGDLPIYHFGHNGDSIYLGQCNGVDSTCYYGGYLMETKCHIGKECVFDAAKYLKWTPTILHHRITEYLDFVLNPWVSDIPGTSMPTCKANANCKDCSDWNFI